MVTNNPNTDINIFIFFDQKTPNFRFILKILKREFTQGAVTLPQN
tara:strand:- start:11173 stop:11307 length:135 start_codon:yes stop_codon:yes gene_type:complete